MAVTPSATGARPSRPRRSTLTSKDHVFPDQQHRATQSGEPFPLRQCSPPTPGQHAYTATPTALPVAWPAAAANISFSRAEPGVTYPLTPPRDPHTAYTLHSGCSICRTSGRDCGQSNHASQARTASVGANHAHLPAPRGESRSCCLKNDVPRRFPRSMGRYNHESPTSNLSPGHQQLDAWRDLFADALHRRHLRSEPSVHRRPAATWPIGCVTCFPHDADRTTPH